MVVSISVWHLAWLTCGPQSVATAAHLGARWSAEERARHRAEGETESDAPQALSTDSVERLPVYNKSAWRHYQTIQEAGDWCVPSTEPKNTSTYRVS